MFVQISVDLKLNIFYFQLKFEGTVGTAPTYQGDIALDDIFVTPGRCPSPTPTATPSPCAIRCKNNTCVPANKLCDFVNDCGSSDDTDEKKCGSCDFENGKIGMELTPESDLKIKCVRGVVI